MDSQSFSQTESNTSPKTTNRISHESNDALTQKTALSQQNGRETNTLQVRKKAVLTKDKQDQSQTEEERLKSMAPTNTKEPVPGQTSTRGPKKYKSYITSDTNSGNTCRAGGSIPNVNHNRPVNEIVPKVWVISNFAVPVSQQIAIEVLKKGDIVVLGCGPGGALESNTIKKAESLKLQAPNRCLIVELNVRNQALCSSTVATVLEKFGRIDILVNSTSRTYVGALEEVEEWHFRHQMDITFYGTVNMIQAVLPCMRKQFYGHIVTICDINGNIGTPALSLLAASMHAIEGYSEALAFEVAPFNIKVTMVEAPMEVNLFTTPIVFAAPLPQYGPSTMVGRVRDMLGKANIFPKEAFDQTVHTVISIGGLDNPPGRIIVGKDAIRQIKDKLAMLSDDLEEFQNVGEAADFEQYNLCK